MFLFEIRNEKAKACELAKDAFDAAIEELDNLPDAAYKVCVRASCLCGVPCERLNSFASFFCVL